MLALRVFTRPTTTLSRGFQLQRRFIHPSRPQLHELPRPNNLIAKIHFRANGEPRSKRIASSLEYLHYGLLILSCWFSIPVIIDEIKSFQIKKSLNPFEELLYIVETYTTYDSFNFDDPISTASYFTKICRSSTSSGEELNQLFKSMMRQTIKTKDGSTQSAEVPIHHIMRSAAEKIHDAIEEAIDRDSRNAMTTDELFKLYELVTIVGIEALRSLLDLRYVYDDSHKANWELLSR